MKDNIRVLISQEELENRIKEMAAQISKDYEGEELHLICILRGSVFFTCELAKYLTIPVTIDFMTASSYRDQMKTSGKVDIMKELESYSDEWAYLVKHYFKPKCEVAGYCTEKKCCGRMPKAE